MALFPEGGQRMTQNTRGRAPKNAPALTASVIRVGEGRGFVVEDAEGFARFSFRGDRLVVTAAHCLPFFPPCHSCSYLHDRTYEALLGPLGQKPTVWAECLFVDPIGDIAVLGPPDDQELSEKHDGYRTLMAASAVLPISDPPENGRAWLLSLDGRWFRCNVKHSGGPLCIADAVEGIVGGMSGSPIVADDGSAIGVVCTAGGINGDEAPTEGGPNPRLVYHLPARFLCPARDPPSDALASRLERRKRRY
jgi:hypothetical protein